MEFPSVLGKGAAVVDPAIDGLREMLRGLRQVDHALGSGPALAIVKAQLLAAETILNTARSSMARRSALAVVAEIHQLAGWMHFDRGEVAEAETAFSRARTLSEESGDPALAAYILGPSHGFMTASVGHLSVAREQCRIGVAAARRSGNHRLTGFVLAIAARVEAKAGERRACLSMLDAAATELDLASAGASSSPDPDWLSVFDDAALAGHRGSCLLDLQSPHAAIISLTTQDETADGLFVRNRVIWQLDRCDAYLKLGDLEPACEDLWGAWEASTGTTSIRLTHRLATSLNKLVPWQNTREVKNLRARVLDGSV
ncbi:hypothetical protein Kisp01_70060 [Kineosporia sp. NBRC 101677]|nr:hypothetical protein Kisp01_70060 [Kineosporia sp. NBRC 101677]